MSYRSPDREIPYVGGPLCGQKTTSRALTLHPDGSTAPARSAKFWSAYEAFEWIRSRRALPKWRRYSLIYLSEGVSRPRDVYLWAPLWCHQRMIDLVYRDPETFELEWQHCVREVGELSTAERYAQLMGDVR